MSRIIDPGGPMVIEALGAGQTAAGWRHLWLKYVFGFSGGCHCAACLLGPYSKIVRKEMPHGRAFPLNESLGFNCVYLCGVAARGGWAANLHLAAEHAPGESAIAEASTGSIFRIANGRSLAIPDLPFGYAGKPSAFTTCRNWRFGVHRFGLSPKPPE